MQRANAEKLRARILKGFCGLSAFLIIFVIFAPLSGASSLAVARNFFGAAAVYAQEAPGALEDGGVSGDAGALENASEEKKETAREVTGLSQIEENIALGKADIRVTIAKIIRAALGLLGIVALGIVIYAGFIWMTAGGDAEKILRAKQFLINGGIGLVIIFSAFSITQFVIGKLGEATGLGDDFEGSAEDGRLRFGVCQNPPCDGGAFVVKISPFDSVEAANAVVKLHFQSDGKSAAFAKSSLKKQENVEIKDQNGNDVPFDIVFYNAYTAHLIPTLRDCPEPFEEKRECFAPGVTYTVNVKGVKMERGGARLQCGGGLPAAFSCSVKFTAGAAFDTGIPESQIIFPRESDSISVGSSLSVQARGLDDHGISSIAYFFNNRQFYASVFSGKEKGVIDEYNWFIDESEWRSGEPIKIKTVVWDVDGNASESSVTVTPRPSRCSNRIKDADEAGVDCGGVCGACGGSACRTNQDCASGVCSIERGRESGVCIDVPRIDFVDPESSGPHTFVTVAGNFFGDTPENARACFLKDPSAFSCEDQVMASAPSSCGPASWSQNQVVLEVPEELKSAEKRVRLLDFDGATEYLSIPEAEQKGLNFSSSLTLEAYVGFEGQNAEGKNQFIISRGAGEGDNTQYALYLTKEGNLGFAVRTSEGALVNQITEKQLPGDGSIHHIAGVYNGNEMTWYIDGKEERRMEQRGNIENRSARFAIGASPLGASRFFAGILHSAAVWNRALSGDVILEHSKGPLNFAGVSSGQAALWRFDGNLEDKTQNKNNLAGANIGESDYVLGPGGGAGGEGNIFPVRLERRINGVYYGDGTSDTVRGAYMPRVFTLTNVERPGLCFINPAAGPPLSAVEFRGERFGSRGSGSSVVFGGRNAEIEAWSNSSINTKVPNLSSGRVGAFVLRQGVASNSMEFKVQSRGAENIPSISTIDPISGAVGQYITIFGKNLGENKEKRDQVIFEITDSDTVRKINQAGAQNFFPADLDFPAVCAANVWQDGGITAKVPQSLKGFIEKEKISAIVYVRFSGGSVVTNSLDFNILSGSPVPGICAVSPSNGPYGANIHIHGEGLTPTPSGKVYFYAKDADVINKNLSTFADSPVNKTIWNLDGRAGEILAQVPGDGDGPQKDATTGILFVSREDDGGVIKLSNSIPFTVFNCVQEKNSCPKEIFGDGVQCCASGRFVGSCLASCQAALSKSELGWQYSTGKLPLVPKVVEQCDKVGGSFLPSPSPWEEWTEGAPVCLNAGILVMFDKVIENPAGRAVLEKCVGLGKNPCENTETVNSKVEKSGDRALEIIPVKIEEKKEVRTNLNPDSYFQVRLLAGLLASSNGERQGIGMPESKRFSDMCGKGTAYCFRFSTMTEGDSSNCRVKSVLVYPRKFTAFGFGVLVSSGDPKQAVIDTEANPQWEQQYSPLYGSFALDSPEKCVSVAGLSWNWSTSDFSKAEITGSRDRNADRKGDPTAFVRTKLHTESPIDVIATEAQSLNFGTSTLKIEPAAPAFLSFYPSCNTACVNTAIGFITNQAMVASSTPGVRLFRCSDELCTLGGRASVETINIIQDADAEALPVNDERRMAIVPMKTVDGNKIFAALEKNSYYIVTISAVQNKYGQNFENKNFIFKTKESGELCAIESVKVVPDPIIAFAKDDLIPAFLEPKGSKSSCGLDGADVLNPFLNEWSWDAEGGVRGEGGYSGNTIAKVSNFDFSYQISTTSTPNAAISCNAFCLRPGSSRIAAFCGDGVISSSEECEPDVDIGCGGNCKFIGTSPSCGNGTLERGVGEACDDGNSINGDGCSSRCLWEEGTQNYKTGTLPSKEWCSRTRESGVQNMAVYPQCASAAAVCGNGDVEEGEDCDFGSRAENFAFNNCDYNTCLWTGAKKISETGGTCGDGNTAGENEIPDFGEQCDDGNNTDGDGCSSVCLLEGASPRRGSICGDGALGSGEACELPSSTKDGKIDPVQLTIAVGQGPIDPATKKQKTSILVAETSGAFSGIGMGNYELQCGYTRDEQCSNSSAYGIDSNGCCGARPILSGAVPYDGAAGVCRNALIRVESNVPLMPSSVNKDSVKLVRVSNGACSENEVQITVPEAKTISSFEKLKRVLSRLTGGLVFAQVYCAQNIANPVYEESAAGKFINIKLDSPLEIGAHYQVLILGGESGVKGADGVKLARNRKWRFVTGSNICKLNSVSIVPESATLTSIAPGTGEACSKDSDCGGEVGSCFKRPGAKIGNCSKNYRIFTVRYLGGALDGPQNMQSIVPTADYNWELNWTPLGSGPVIRFSQEERNPNAAKAEAVANGETTVFASVKITTDAVFSPSTSGTEKSDSSDIKVFICNNPWPAVSSNRSPASQALNFPYEDKSGSDDGVNPQDINLPDGRRIGRPFLFGNFSVHYCRDAKDATILDDLPHLEPRHIYVSPQQFISEESGKRGLIEQAHFRNPNNNDLIGIRVMRNDNLLSLSDWYRMERPDDPKGIQENETVDGFPAARKGNTVYISVADIVPDFDGVKFGLTGRVFVISVTGAGGREPNEETKNIFEQFIKNIRFNIGNAVFSSLPYCYKNSTPALPLKRCTGDFECAAGEECRNYRDKIRRDWKRLRDFAAISSALTNYYGCSSDANCAQNAKRAFPVLKETSARFGSYLPYTTNSKWSSWQGALGNTLGGSLPLDPVNKFFTDISCTNDSQCGGALGSCVATGRGGGNCAVPSNYAKRCGRVCNVHTAVECSSNSDCPQGETCLEDNGFSSESCWNNSIQEFLCPAKSMIYKYETNGRGDAAALKSFFEYDPMQWKVLEFQNTRSRWWSERGWTDKISWNVNGACSAQSDRFGLAGSCGDGVVNARAGEECEGNVFESSAECSSSSGGITFSGSSNPDAVAQSGEDETIEVSGSAVLNYTFKINEGTFTLGIEGNGELGAYWGDAIVDGNTCDPQGKPAFGLRTQLLKFTGNDYVPYRTQPNPDIVCIRAISQRSVGSVTLNGLETGDYKIRLAFNSQPVNLITPNGVRVSGANLGSLFINKIFLSGFLERRCDIATCRWESAAGGCRAADARFCGDGTLQPEREQCDDGRNNGRYGGWCTADCRGVTPYCGDGIFDRQNEFCDPTAPFPAGAGTAPSGRSRYSIQKDLSCRFDCLSYGPYCGDAKPNDTLYRSATDNPWVDRLIINDGTNIQESCDDGNRVSGDGCSVDCRVEAPVCGDGRKTGVEQCDDGNNASGDGCMETCEVESGYFCPNQGQLCSIIQCGNGILDPGEECDNGQQNRSASPGCPYGQSCNYCSNECRIMAANSDAYCGNGSVDFQSPEVCDWGSARISDAGAPGGSRNVRTWDEYRNALIAGTLLPGGRGSGMDSADVSDRNTTQDWWCINVPDGYRDYPASCSPDCTARLCIDRTPSGADVLRNQDTLCDEQISCPTINIAVRDEGGLKDDFFEVGLTDRRTGVRVNLGEQRIRYARSKGITNSVKAKEWGLFGREWKWPGTTGPQSPSAERDEAYATIGSEPFLNTRSVNLGHLPVGRYSIDVVNYYGIEFGTFDLLDNSQAAGTDNAVVRPTNDRNNNKRLDTPDYSDESRGVSSITNWLINVNDSMCLKPTELVETGHETLLNYYRTELITREDGTSVTFQYPPGCYQWPYRSETSFGKPCASDSDCQDERHSVGGSVGRVCKEIGGGRYCANPTGEPSVAKYQFEIASPGSPL